MYYFMYFYYMHYNRVDAVVLIFQQKVSKSFFFNSSLVIYILFLKKGRNWARKVSLKVYMKHLKECHRNVTFLKSVVMQLKDKINKEELSAIVTFFRTATLLTTLANRCSWIWKIRKPLEDISMKNNLFVLLRSNF